MADTRARRPSLALGAYIGFLTSLPFMAMLYLGLKGLNLPFVPFDLFEWLARVLPGGILRVALDTLVNLVDRLNVGPIASVAKALEMLLGILFFVIAAVLVGLLVAALLWLSLAGENRSAGPHAAPPLPTRRRGVAIGAGVGAVVYVLVALFEVNLGLSIDAHPAWSLAYLACLVVGWSALVGLWVAAAAVPRLETAQLGGRPAEQKAEISEGGVVAGNGRPDVARSRRAFLAWLSGGSIAVALAVWGLGRFVGHYRQVVAGAPTPGPGGTPGPSGPFVGVGTPIPLPQQVVATATAEATVRADVPLVPGTRSNVTSNADFYRVDINLTPPNIDERTWALDVSGLFDRPRALTMPDLFAYPATTQPSTLCCISNPIGGDLISTTYYTGVRLGIVLDDLGIRPEATDLNLRSADRFFETVSQQDMMDPRTLLVYGMNGEAIPRTHGYPLRIYIPNRYGMKQPKWIVAMQATTKQPTGYWEQRGWSAEAIPHIVSIIDAVAVDSIETNRVPVGGIAWAGARGISRVEVQVDNGDWAQAELRIPPVGPLTWVQWRYEWPVISGSHTFRVRATDGTGALQVGESHGSYPDGATGYDTKTVSL